MKWFWLGVFLLKLNCFAESTEDFVALIKKELKGTMDNIQRNKFAASNDINRCTTRADEQSEINLYAFISFSMPDEALITLAEEVEKERGVLVLRGIPKNSFKELSKRVQRLQKKGLKTAIQINPHLFEQYDVTVVPSFVLKRENDWDKVSGNISLQYVLELSKKTAVLTRKESEET